MCFILLVIDCHRKLINVISVLLHIEINNMSILFIEAKVHEFMEMDYEIPSEISYYSREIELFAK